jgi:transcriptional regulator with XRE-family HTH domain
MSQSDLAKQLGVSFQQVQKYEKGTNRVGAGHLPKIAGIFDVPISALFEADADTSAGRSTARAAPVRLISDPGAIRLLTSYADIKDRVIRRGLVQLADAVARPMRRKERKGRDE